MTYCQYIEGELVAEMGEGEGSEKENAKTLGQNRGEERAVGL